jgi:signal transduction histidine kinase
VRILIAEDDTTSRMILSELVTRLGHDVVTAVSGREAWRIFHQEHVPLVISDWMMPDLDGLELTRRIRAENRARYTYVILLTALSGKENYLEAMRVGADDFVTKPLDADQLHARLRVAARVLRLQRELVQLQLSQQQIVQRERLRALGEMASGIAHDFSNALSVVLGFSGMLLMRPVELGDKEKVRRRLELISAAAHDAAQLVRRLREFYRPRDHAEVFLPVDVNAMIRTAVAVSEPRWKAQTQAAGAPVRVKVDLGDVPPVDGNVSELRDVLMNLIFNGVDAMPQGGTLRIASEVDEARHAVLVTIEDTGVGMTEEVRRRCLEPFFTTKGDQGTGLGLAMAYGVVERHRGVIEVESQPGVGTKFRVRLPARASQAEPPRALACDVGVRPLRVLVVEDEAAPRQVLVESLAGDGHVVETAANGREGLQRFQAGWFDVVITDRAMPELNGVELAMAIRQIAPRKPVIILLSGFDEGGVAGDLPPGIDVVLTKPVPLERLRAALRGLA